MSFKNPVCFEQVTVENTQSLTGVFRAYIAFQNQVTLVKERPATTQEVSNELERKQLIKEQRQAKEHEAFFSPDKIDHRFTIGVKLKGKIAI